jgi:ribosomal protein S27E
MGRRGRPPRQLVKLYGLLLKNPLASNEELAKELGVRTETVSLYRWRLERNSVSLYKICPECMRETVVLDEERGERACRSCGYVVESVPQFSDDLPFDTTYALTNHLAFGKSLGGTLPLDQLYKVLAQAPEGITDLPIRSAQIQVLSSAVEPPVVRRMLDYGSRMLKQLGLDRDTDECHILSDQYGRCIRTAAAFLQVSKMKAQPHLVARAALYHILIQLYPEKAETARWIFPFPERCLTLVEQLDVLVRRVEAKPSRRRPPS